MRPFSRRILPFAFPLLFNLSMSTVLGAQHPTPAATSVGLMQAVRKLGGDVPEDSVVVGDVTITAGTSQEEGVLRVVTKGSTHTVEIFKTNTALRHLVFADGIASERAKGRLKELPYGRVLTSRSALVPLTFLSAKMSEPRSQVLDLGNEPAGNTSSRHLQISQDLSADKHAAAYQEFTIYDVWLDPNTSLPSAISYRQREGLGAIPWVAMRLEYEDYRPVNGLLYPYHITKYVNGTKWADIRITSVTLNTGVDASGFAIK